ncbi:hypothetical protein [Actinoallomurus sp. NPDC052274]|uniref:hypothetical protein n=1 Tax=Actinoallomurus sp. NPDC052274 TaxID=3155420 RepID=UPI003447AB33
MTRRDGEMSDELALGIVVNNLASLDEPGETTSGDVRRSYTDEGLAKAQRRVFGEKPTSS